MVVFFSFRKSKSSGYGQFPKPGVYLSHLPPTETPKFKPYFPNMETATKRNRRENVQDKGVQVPKQVLEWLPCQGAFFRFTDLHFGFSHTHAPCKLLSEGRKLEVFSIGGCG